jgi:hypothetical protein
VTLPGTKEVAMLHRATILAASLAAAALAVPAATGAGNGQVADWIKIGTNAELVAPTTLYVKVTYSCLGTHAGGSGSVVVRQSAVVGATDFPAVCDDSSHTETVAVIGAFTPGNATAVAQICGDFCGDNVDSPTEITIR